jgi:hypothetical protein
VAHVVFLEHGFDLCCLGDGDGEVVIGVGLLVIAFSEEPCNVAHPVNFEFEREGSFEYAFNRIASAVVGEVVNVDAQIKWRFAFNEDLSEDAWIVRTGGHADVKKSSTEGLVPVFRATTETVEGLVQ